MAALSDSTHKSYRTAEQWFLKFCSDFALRPFPVTENILCYFVACLGQQGLAHSTIKSYLSGMRQAQIARGFHEPNMQAMPRLRQMLKGVQVVQGKKGQAPKPRLPVTPGVLRKMKAVWADQGDLYDIMMMWAAATTTFFSFCRAGEIVVEREDSYDPNSHLSFRDIAMDDAKSPSMVSLLLRHSKTDQACKGVKIVIGKTGDDLCPIAALLAKREDCPGPLFMCSNGKPLMKTRFVTEIRSALTKAKRPARDYAGHSFRIGAATTAAVAGLEDSLIQTLGRWKSSAYLTYVRIDPRRLAGVSNVLSHCSI